MCSCLHDRRKGPATPSAAKVFFFCISQNRTRHHGAAPQSALSVAGPLRLSCRQLHITTLHFFYQQKKHFFSVLHLKTPTINQIKFANVTLLGTWGNLCRWFDCLCFSCKSRKVQHFCAVHCGFIRRKLTTSLKTHQAQCFFFGGGGQVSEFFLRYVDVKTWAVPQKPAWRALKIEAMFLAQKTPHPKQNSR